MQTSEHGRSIIANPSDYDAVVVGASLAGCTTALLLGRAGLRVALVEKQPDPAAFKRMCSHFIQASAVPTLRRAGLLEPIEEAGAIRSRACAWTQWGWIDPPRDPDGYAVNLRRELLDPLVRGIAAETPGVKLMLGLAAHGLVREDGAVRGLAVHDRSGTETVLRAPLVVGADGRDSRIAELSGVKVKTLPHARFAYGAYFEGPAPERAPDGAFWMLDPHWAAAFPTDGDQTFYAAMPTKDLLPEFKRDPEAALIAFVGGVPDPPPIRASKLVSPVLGKLDMPNRVRVVTAPGLALVGDAALATDPLFGVGCGWAFQSAEWLVDSVVPALQGSESLARGLERYRRRHTRQLRMHAFFIHDYATGRRLSPFERSFFAAAARDQKVAASFDKLGTRRSGPVRALGTALPRVLLVNARHKRSRRHAQGAAAVGEAARA